MLHSTIFQCCLRIATAFCHTSARSFFARCRRIFSSATSGSLLRRAKVRTDMVGAVASAVTASLSKAEQASLIALPRPPSAAFSSPETTDLRQGAYGNDEAHVCSWCWSLCCWQKADAHTSCRKQASASPQRAPRKPACCRAPATFALSPGFSPEPSARFPPQRCSQLETRPAAAEAVSSQILPTRTKKPALKPD